MLLKQIIIVSGLQRSGTAMLMQMLTQGGITPFIDDKRAADECNPNGYYEHSMVQQLATKNFFLRNAVDKVIKVYAKQLQQLPPEYRYKIIFVERDIYEVWASRHKVYKYRGHEVKEGFFSVRNREGIKRTIEQIKEWAALKNNVDLLGLQYSEIIEHPLENSKKIQTFLQQELDIDKMAGAVDPSLHREKGDKNFLITDRAPISISKIIDQYAKDKIYCEIGIGEGHTLNAVKGSLLKFGVEIDEYGVNRCRELYPRLNVKKGDILELLPHVKFEVCYLWLTYPIAEEVVNKILEKNKNTIVLMGLNYFYHLDTNDEKYQRYVAIYPPHANAKEWNASIKKHLSSLEERGFKHSIQQVKAENDELFSVAIIQKT